MAVYKEEKMNTWRAVYRYTDWNGERKQTQKRGFKTKREAQAWEREQLNKTSADLDMTFKSFVDLYTADMDTARTEAAVWTGICIALFAAGALALTGVCLGHQRGKAMAWCTALAAILSVGCLIAMLAAGHGALRTLCLCAAVALLALAFVAAGLTLRQCAERAQ